MEEFISETLEIENEDEIFDQLMKNYGQDILQLVFSYVRDRAIAEDLTQDIFVKVYNNLNTYGHKSSIRTWLWSIAINHCKDFLRSWYNRNVLVSDMDFSQQTSNQKSVEVRFLILRYQNKKEI